MKTKRFKNNKQYFKYIKKNKDLIKIIKVNIKNNFIYIYYEMLYN